jgi:LmbE family N-acetylglucosaminyl deacetylase
LNLSSLLRFSPVLLLAMGLQACGPADVPLDASGPEESAEAALASIPSRHLYVVAHEDDDLLFMNPDLQSDIQAGRTVQTVFLTAGDAGRETAYWLRREAGIRDSYAYMARVANSWSYSQPLIAGKQAHRYTLTGAPNVSITFLRLPDGNPGGTGYNGNGSLQLLWEGQRSTLSALDAGGAASRIFTLADLTNVLQTLMVQTGAQHVHTLDSTDIYGWDHSDHIYSAKIAFEASQRFSTAHEFSNYRTYNIESDPINLSSNEMVAKREVFKRYDAYDGCYGAADMNACLSQWNNYPGSYGAWLQRMSSLRKLAPFQGRITGLGGKCLNVASSANGTPVQLSQCNGTAAQEWQVMADGRILGLGGKCLDVRGGSTANGTAIQVWDCAGVVNQQWKVMSNGQLRGHGGKCLDVRGGSTADGTPIQLWDCVSTANQLWSPALDMPYYPAWGDFGDGDLGSHVSYYGSVRMADVNGDGFADGCARRADGVYCALNNQGGVLGPMVRYTPEYSDALGWRAAQYGATLQLGDINGDGRADLCGRGGAGIWCSLSAGTAFVNTALWSTSFSDAAGMLNAASYYGSFRLGDVNGDGFADACARGASGVYCALNTRSGGFAPDRLFTTEFNDAAGWLPSQYGTTLQLGDINGDGRADVCGSGDRTFICAVANANGSGFMNPHPWGFMYDFSTLQGWGSAAGYYGSIRLGDVNGDGYADVCGRDSLGVSCAFSSVLGFGPMRRVMPFDYLDAYGWQPEQYGATLMLADLNRDGRADLCGRGINGLMCSQSP